jgi:UDP-N-acetylglucosamine diphosphorylase / glucose-1-phosphate thymidylyltransferase / UDP-N-acetylgalactosamine diphosphorylase / glucosamine-1-phosphate N-acetyltransferase / galactosamine-1-phosphate N-acetyltransferase
MTSLPECFDLGRIPSVWRGLFDPQQPWATLAAIDALLSELEALRAGDIHPTAIIEGPVRIEAGAQVGPYALIQGPAWLMSGAKVGHGAMLRGGVLMAPRAKVGHASEVKRSLLLEGAQVPHFNYVGDSLLGHDVNLGAGVKLANLRVVGGGIRVNGFDTGLRKLGAVVGDRASIGCNAVLAPGTVVGRDSIIYDGATVRGVVPAESIVKLRSQLVTVPRRWEGTS